MTTLYVAPGSVPSSREVSFHDMEAELGIVSFAYPFDDPFVAIAFDDDGIANHRPPNRTLNNQIIPGPFFILSVTDDGEVTALAPDLVEKYTQLLKEPEFFPEGKWKVITKVEDQPYAAVVHIVSEWVATDTTSQTSTAEKEAHP